MKLSIILGWLVCSLMASEPQQLLPLQESDFQPRVLIQEAQSIRPPMMSQETVVYNRALSDADRQRFNEKTLDRPVPASVLGQYGFSVSADEAQEGIALPISGKGSVIRIFPDVETRTAWSSDLGFQFDPKTVALVSERGEVFRGEKGFRSLLDWSRMQDAGQVNPDPVLTIALNEELAPGTYTVFLEAYSESFPLSVRVLEKSSPYQLAFRSNDRVYEGELLSFSAQFLAAEKEVAAQWTSTQVQLKTPDGRRLPLSLETSRGSVRGSLALRGAQSMQGGLWELEGDFAAVIDGIEVRRQVETAVEVVLPTARLTGRVVVEGQKNRGDLVLHLGTEVAQSGRYEVRATLVGVTREGRAVPLATLNTAQGLLPGNQQLSLVVERSLLNSNDALEHLEPHDLSLRDQTMMTILSHQARAFVF